MRAVFHIPDFRKLYNLHMSARHLIDADLEIRSAKKITDLVASGKDLTKEGLRAQISSILVNAGHEKPSVNIETTIIDTGSRHHTIRLSSFEGQSFFFYTTIHVLLF